MKILKTAAVVLGLAAVKLWAGADEGKELFSKSCKTCHGADGQGNPTIAKMMKVEFKPLGAAEVQGQTDEQLKTIITKGKGKMKPVSTLSSRQADDVIAYLRTLKK